MDPIDVATLNIRNIADRWTERLPLLIADMAALQPDVLGLQEVVFPVQQDRLIGAAGERRYEVFRAEAGRPEYGNALLVGARFAATTTERLDLGWKRSALRVDLAAPGGPPIDVVVTHLHHEVADESVRAEQAAKLIAWLDDEARESITIVVGDFNAEPSEPTYARMTEAGFRSSFLEANSAEPPVTWPSGIQAPGMDTDGDPGCLDYIWVRGAVRVDSCRVVFDRPAVDDPTLFPSDHFGLIARLRVGE